jgi:hypothetical protein
LWLGKKSGLSPHDPFLQIAPHVIGRLKSLVIEGNTHPITTHLSHPAPLLEYLSIRNTYGFNPLMLKTTPFNGDLSSLRELYLQSVCTELPWKNMVNLTSFELCYTPSGGIPTRQFLDFFENAPHLHKIRLYFVTSTSSTQNGRLVSLSCLKRMDVFGDKPPSPLLNHLIIPIGAKLTTEAALGARGLPMESLLPRSLYNLRNLSGLTNIHLRMDRRTRMRFAGPNGQVCMAFLDPRGDLARSVVEHLAQFDTSKTEQLKIEHGDLPSYGPPHRTLLPMKHLRTLTLSQCVAPHLFTRALDPRMSSSGVVVCPKLEVLVLVLRRNRETLDIKDVIEMAAGRASRGAKLKSVRIVSQGKFMKTDVLGLEKHVLHMECGHEVNVANEDGDDGDEEG